MMMMNKRGDDGGVVVILLEVVGTEDDDGVNVMMLVSCMKCEIDAHEGETDESFKWMKMMVKSEKYA